MIALESNKFYARSQSLKSQEVVNFIRWRSIALIFLRS